jgi:hypothetical protein
LEDLAFVPIKNLEKMVLNTDPFEPRKFPSRGRNDIDNHIRVVLRDVMVPKNAVNALPFVKGHFNTLLKYLLVKGNPGCLEHKVAVHLLSVSVQTQVT